RSTPSSQSRSGIYRLSSRNECNDVGRSESDEFSYAELLLQDNSPPFCRFQIARLAQFQSTQRTGCRIGRLRMISSFLGFTSNVLQVANHCGFLYANPPIRRTGDRTGQNSQQFTSGSSGQADLSLM